PDLVGSGRPRFFPNLAPVTRDRCLPSGLLGIRRLGFGYDPWQNCLLHLLTGPLVLPLLSGVLCAAQSRESREGCRHDPRWPQRLEALHDFSSIPTRLLVESDKDDPFSE